MESVFIDVDIILALHDRAIAQWKASTVECSEILFLKIVEENHAFNFQLWHAEDRARRDDMGYEFVYLAKREIDFCNQQRNDRMEMMDHYLTHELSAAPAHACVVHSETPGMMIDRLSILALKIYHMAEQAERETATIEHRATCHQKLAVLKMQRQQLSVCLMDLLKDVVNKVKTFCTYHQFKMYNDKNLNPQLYCAQSQS